MTLPVIILAGGLATRLSSITQSIPKSLVEVAGKPFISRQLSYLEKQGIKKVVLCIGHLGEMIESFIGTGKNYNLEVIYSHDGPNLLGTGGATKKASSLIDSNFFILYGDSFLPIDYRGVMDAFDSSRYRGLMTILKNEDRWDKSNVTFVSNELIEYNKDKPSLEMDYIDYGLGILSKPLFDDYKEGFAFDLSEVYRNLSLQNQLQGFQVSKRFYEIGSPKGLEETTNFFLKQG